ncbi:TPA: tRNA (adenosine(37)-N6)-threonylcarbamoyltransferase complex ATPase subunit type 1 TsaE [Candidatus Kaiserbacteria bacterium]|nr:MAG: ATPase, YjeE family [Parcubacteria group bacterium GW2011_GWA1_56_13]KKW47006.1 MAG: ATPase, YjeE family [Parcubacteria group bacterium GW2011_GWB1_57_6]HCR52471.1 tRNA (adenosine(37)-N6)-threonylcarbamoyltransferase complex ATPase subunit type 1 TsaE [Candidatus Kaiserbacteria bacterium]
MSGRLGTRPDAAPFSLGAVAKANKRACLDDRRAFIFSGTIVLMEKVVHTLAEFDAEAARFAASLIPGEGATFITLSGELGAGKTAFAKAVALSLGVKDVVTSPTFVLEKVYQLPEGKPFQRLIHIDAYRLEKGADLAPLNFDELMRDRGNLVFLEWPEKVADALPKAAARIMLTTRPDGSRILSYG